LPGIKKQEVKIEIEENILRVRGERKEKKHHESAKQHYSEVSYGSFTREFALSSSLEKEKIKARYEDGVLFITVPKSLKSKAQQVSIE
jgi:HSP20 family protein